VIAVDIEDSKLDLARQLGADYVVNARTTDPVEAIRDLGGADVAISLATSPRAFEQAFGSLRRGGRLVCVALPADDKNSTKKPGAGSAIIPSSPRLRGEGGTRAAGRRGVLPGAQGEAWPMKIAGIGWPHGPPVPAPRSRRLAGVLAFSTSVSAQCSCTRPHGSAQ